MKNIFAAYTSPAGTRSAGRRGTTLVEMMMAMGVFSMAIIASVYVNLFGMSQDELAETKCGASDSARRGFNQLSIDIRSSKIYQIGSYVNGTFNTNANGTGQVGNAIMLNLTTNLNDAILYYFVTNSAQLWRTSAVDPSSLVVQYLTNTMYFDSEDYTGTMQTNRTHKGVIHTSLQFAQFQYPLTKVGTNYFYDYYKMEFRFTPHVPDGP